MRKDIHPKYYSKAFVHCACGNNFSVGSTKEHIETEVCFQCHPFYTKKEKLMDVLGQVQKFKTRMSKKRQTSRSKKQK